MVPTPPLRGAGEAAEASGVQDGRGGAHVLAAAAKRLLLPGDPLHRLRAAAGQPLPHVPPPPSPPTHPSPKPQPLLRAHCRLNKRCSHCLASYKYIEECRLPKYFTVRPNPLHAATHSWRRPPPPIPSDALCGTRPLHRAGGALAGSRSTMPPHAPLSAPARGHPLRSGAPRSDPEPLLASPPHLLALPFERRNRRIS